MVVCHFEGCTLWFHLEGADRAFREFGDKEGIVVFFVKGGAWVEGEACGTVGVVDVRGGDVGGLEFAGRLPNVFRHPRVVFRSTVLVVVPPAGIGTLGDVEETLALALAVGIVIDGEDVSVLVEGDLLGVAEAAGENFKTRSVRVGPQHGALVRGEVVRPFLGGDVGPLVADGPVDAPVGAEGGAVHVVAGVSDVDAETLDEGFALVGFSVPGGIAEFPDIGSDGGIDVAPPCEDAGCDAGHIGVESISEKGLGVHHAVAVGIGQTDDFFTESGQVFDVHHAVPVVVLERGVIVEFSGDEFFFEKGTLLLQGCECDVVGDPAVICELADI